MQASIGREGSPNPWVPQAAPTSLSKEHTKQAPPPIPRSNKQDIRAYMESLGFGRLDLVTSFPVKMAGSGRQFQLYVLRKPDWKTLAKSAAMVGDVTPLLPEERPIVVAASDRGRSAGNTPAVGVSEAAQGQASNAHAESTEIEARRASAGASESTVRLER